MPINKTPWQQPVSSRQRKGTEAISPYIAKPEPYLQNTLKKSRKQMYDTVDRQSHALRDFVRTKEHTDSPSPIRRTIDDSIGSGMDWAKENPDFNYQSQDDYEWDRTKEDLADLWVDLHTFKDKELPQAFSDLMQDLNLTGSSTTAGEIGINKDRQASAELYKGVLELDDLLDNLLNQRDYLEDAYKKNPNDKDILKKLNDVYTKINQVATTLDSDEVKQIRKDYQTNVGDSGLDGIWNRMKLFAQDTATKFAHLQINDTYDSITKENARLEANHAKARREQFDKFKQETLDDLSEEERRMYNSLPAEQQKKYLDRVVNSNYIKKLDDENKELIKDYNEDIADAADWQRWIPVSKSFKEKKRKAQDASLLDPRYYMYAAPSTIGSSFSSPYQAASMAIRAGGAVGGGALTATGNAGAGAALYNVAETVATFTDTAAGFDENYAEVADRSAGILAAQLNQMPEGKDILEDLRKQSVKKRIALGYSKKEAEEISDEDVAKDALAGLTKTTHPYYKVAEMAALEGSQAQFWRDNMATMGETFQSYLIQLMPQGNARSLWNAGVRQIKKGATKAGEKIGGKIGKSVVNWAKDKEGNLVAAGINETEEFAQRRAAQALDDAVEDGSESMYKSVKNRAKGYFKKGESLGETAAQLTGQGYVGQLAYGKTAGAVGTALGFAADGLKTVGGKLVPQAVKDGARSFQKFLISNYHTIGNKILPSIASKDLAKYGLNLAWKGAVSAFNEGAEEGRQYLNSKADYSGYGHSFDPLLNLPNLLISDFVNGARVGQSYLAMLGIGSSPLLDDAEYIQNVKGGFALGGMNTSVMNVATRTPGMVRQISTDSYIENSGVFTRDADQNNRAQYSAFAKTAAKGRVQETLHAMDMMRKRDLSSKSPQFTEEEWDRHVQDATTVMMNANNPILRNKLEAKGIQYGSDEYFNAIADYTILVQNHNANVQEATELANKMRQNYESKEFDDDVREQVRQTNQGSQVEELGKRFGVETAEQEQSEAIAKLNEQAKVKKGNSKHKRAMSEEAAQELDALLEQEMEMSDEDRAAIQEQNESKGIDEVNNALGLYDSLKAKTILVSRLKGLLKLRAQANTVDDYFKMLRDNFKLKIARPDAKTVSESISRQIDEVKEQLKELTDVSLEGKDGDVLENLDKIETVGKWVEALEEDERANALLAADREVTQKYIDLFNEGLTEDKDDKGNKTGRYTFDKTKKNRYKDYISKVMSAKTRSTAVNWAVNDAFAGNLEDEVKPEKATTEDSKNTKGTTEDSKKTKGTKKYVAPFTGAVDITTENPIMAADETELQMLTSLAVNKSKKGKYSFKDYLDDIKTYYNDKVISDAEEQLKAIYVSASVQPEAKAENLEDMATVLQFDQANYLIPKQRVSNATLAEKLNEINAKVIDDLSNYYDTFVKNDDGTVTVYTNTVRVNEPQYGDGNNFPSLTEDVLNTLDVNTDEEFKLALEHLSDKYNFDVTKYSDYRYVNGIDKIIARAIINNLEQLNPSIKKANYAKETVTNILLGKPVSQEAKDNILNYDKFVRQINALKERFAKAKLSIVDTPICIYGTNSKGQNSFTNSDLLLEDENRNIYIYYVRTSYKDVRGTMHDKTDRNYSDYEYFYKTLSNETEILTNNFNVTINGIGVIPIQAPARSEKSSMDLKEPIAITSAGINNIQPSQLDLSQLQLKYDDFINQYNEKVTTYNSLVQQLGLYGITLPLKNIIASTVFTTVMELQANTESIINNTSSLLSEIDSLNEKLLNAVLNATSQYERVTGIEPVGTQPEDVENKVDALQDRCVQLDHLLQQMPDAKAVTAEDKQNVKDLISLVIDTQTRFDELVSTEDVLNIPMFHERQLISVAMERLYKNKENWGIEHMFVPMKNWWLTKVVIADGSLPVKVNETKYLNAVINGQNTTTGNILYTYLNQIGLWKNSLSDLISLSLQEDEKLQQWYGTLLNTYLQTLIDNALALAERPELKDTDAANVLRGLVNGNGFEEDGIQILIDNFNRQYPNAVPTAKQKADDLKVLDQTAIQINNLPTSWYENGYSQDSHRLDIFAIKNNIDLYTQISTDPEFDPNKYCTLITKGGLPYLHIDFKNKQLDVPIYVPSDYQHKDPNGKSDEFIIKVNAVLDYVKKHPGTHMKVNIVRNNPGYAMYSDNATHNVTEDLIPEEDLYTITFDKDQIGIVTATVGNGMTTYSIKNGQSFNNTIDVLNERRDRIHNGSIVYMKYDTLLEKTNAHQPTPLILQSDTFGAMKDSKDVFVGIINAMRDIQDGKQTLVKDGVTINLYDMLSMCLQMKDQDKYGQLQDVSGVVSIDRYGVRIGRDAISKTGIPFDLKNNDGIQRMLTKLGTMSSRYGNKKILNERLSTSNFSIFKEIRNNLNEFKGNKSDWSFKLPNGFVFTADDFEHKNSDGTFGLTWIGYLLKYGYLKTRYTGNRNYANMWISSPSIELDVKETSFEASVDNSLQMAKLRHDLLASLLDKRAKISSTHKMSKEEEKAAIDYLKSVFGEKFAQKAKELMTNTYIEQLGADGAVIGKCTQDAILLSRQTVPGVTYHEAFHRVLELLLPDKIRESVYKSYRKSNGQHLSDVEVAEGLADEYMDWKNGLDEALSNVTSKYKIIKAFKKLAATIKYLKNTGVGKVQLIAGLMGLGAPKYMKATDARRKRFEEKFGSLNYEIQNTDTKKVAKLRSISSSDQLNAAIDGLIPFLLSAQKIDITGLGDNIKDLKIDGLTPNKIPAKTMNILKNPQFNPRGYLLFLEIFTKKIIEQKDEQTGQIKYIDTYPVFEVLSQKIMQKIDDFTGGHKKVLTDEEYMQQADSYTGEEDTNDAHMGDHIKAAYESKRLDTATKRVKFFFGTIVYSVFEKEKDLNGKDVLTTTFDSSKNMYGLPQFMPINEVFGELVNRVNKVQNARELLEVLEKISTEKPLFMLIYKKFSALYNKQYYKDENGNLKINYDAEATVTQIFETLKSQIMDFQLSSSKSSAKGTTVKINSSSYDTDQHRFPRDWSMMLASGATGVVSTLKDEHGNYIFNRNDNGERYDAKDGKDIFSYTADYLQSLKQQISAYGDIKKINGLNINLNDPVLLQSLLKDVVAHLNKIGIMVNIDGIEYMLSHLYGGNNITGLTKWLNSEGLNSFGKFITFLNSIIDNNTGTLNPEIRKNFDKLYDVIQTKDKQGNITYKGGSGFVINLAINQAAANRTKTDLMVMATKNNRYYSVSLNNTISDICDILSRNDETDSEIKRLKAFNYNVIQDGSNVIGSVILKNLIANNLNIQLKNFAGFKSDNKGDLGSDYYQINDVEDYISKMAILLQDGIIFPTMSDKKTYTFITGIKLPGIDYSANIETIAAQLPRIENAKSMYNGVLSNTMFVQNNAVLDQFIEYAICERAAIQKCIEDLDENNPNKIPESKRVQNYYTNNIFIDKDGNEHVVEPNGTRFSSLTQIDVEEDGRVNTYFLNDPTKSSKDCLALADEKFFNKSKEEQRQIIARSLFKHTKLEIDKCIRLGLITKDNTGNLKNVSLDYEKLDLIRQAIDKNEAYNTCNKELKETLAIYTLLYDVNSKSIMSNQEVERIFSGHPAFYKWNYGYDSKGNPCLVDRFVDEQKRLGGLISTGNNNRTDLPKVTLYRNGVLTELTEDESFTYNCANIADNKVSSTADRIGDFGEYFKRGELLELVLNVSSIDRLEESIYSSADNLLNATYLDGTIKSDYIIDYLKKHKVSQDKIDSALKRADDSLKSYTKKKNKVADGSAFITDAMAETLLRQLGLYSNHVRKAFEILRNPKTAYDYKRNEKAYHTVFEAVIGAQKYSAFGHRDGFEGVLVPYYDKFALFPLFPSVATGKMHDMYEKMKRESVDMVMMDSAVKIGIEGSVSEDDSTSEDKPFNVYKLEFRYLRKQLNTDPNGKAKMALGTQMVKVALYNLIDDLTYHDENGNAVTGVELKLKLFNAINKLTKSGYDKFMSQFYKDSSTEIDPDKLSKLLNEELTSRYTDKKLTEAIQVIKEYINHDKLNKFSNEELTYKNLTEAIQVVEEYIDKLNKFLNKERTSWYADRKLTEATKVVEEYIDPDKLNKFLEITDKSYTEAAQVIKEYINPGKLNKFSNEEFTYAIQVIEEYIDKLNKLLNEELTSRSANKKLIEAVQVVEEYIDPDKLNKFLNEKLTYKNLTEAIQAIKEYINPDKLNKFSNEELTSRSANKKFYKDSSTEIDPDKLSKFLNEELTSRSANKNLIEAIQVVEENGVRRLKMPLAATSDSNWIESIITSKINKQIVDIITPGNAFYQRSVFQMEGDNKDVESGTIREDDGTIYNGKNLQILNEEGSMDAVISIDYFEHIIPKNLKTFEELRQWLIDNNIIGPNAHSNTIASRVPTLAESSINPLRFVDVIAGVKDTIILPKDFTTLTGSDFDIDKLYLATLNYDISKDGKAYTEFEEGSDEYYQNQLLNVYMTLLKDPNTRHITYRSIDNDTDLVENPARKVSKSQTNDNSTLAYNFYTLHELTERKNDYITGKISIGPFALNVTNHALTTAFHVKFKDSVISNIIGINDLDLRRDVDGNAIGSWLSAFINAHVDIVKDPYISVMNVNTYTYNMINLLVRTGKGVAGLNFICNPIIRDMASAYINASGEFGRNSRVSKFQAQKDAVKNVILKYAQIDPKDTKKADAFFEDIEKETSPNNRKDKLEELGRLVNEVLAGENKDQIDVYKAWLVLDKYAKALSRMVAVTKIDTKKQGNTLLAQAAYELKYNDFFLTGDFWDNPMNKKLKEDRIKDMVFDYKSIDYFRNNSFIASKTELAISAMRNVLYGQSFAANKLYLRKVYDVVSTQALSTEPNEQLLGKIDKAILTKIKTDAVLRWAYQNNIRVKDGSFDFKSIFFGNRSVANRINRLKTEIARPGSKYARLASNSLLKLIVVQPSKDNIVGSKKVGGYEYPQTLTLFHGLDEDKTNQDSLIEAWDDLLHDSDENVVMLANELVLYAWLTSGNYQGFNKFFKYVPNSWKEESGFADYVANRISSDLDFIDKEFIDDVIRNNWNEPGLIRNYTVNSGKQNSLVGYKNSALPYSDPIVIAGLHQDGRVVIEPNESGNFPRFIKVKSVIDRSYDENGYRLYKLVGTRQIKGNPVPIYVMDRQRGIHLIGVDIYEYGRLDGYDITDDPAMHFDGYQIQQFADKLEETLSRYNEVSLPTILSSDINGFSASLFMQRDSFDGGSAVVPSVQQQVTSGLKEGDTTDHHTYIGNIQPSDDTVFVFGSNPIGVNGRLDANGQGKDSGGAAAVAQRHFGVKQGELMNNKMSESGKAYGLVTVTAPGAKLSLSLTQIAENFSKMFDVARLNPDKKFKVAFRNTNIASLNGYTGKMLAVAVMTSGQTVPNNVYFSEEWYNAGYVYNFKFDDPVVNNNTTGKVLWARYADNSYEVSSKNDSRFSAMYATFKPGTTLFGHDVSGRTIESVYQHGVKQGDWNTDDNNKTGAPKDKSIITGNTEDDSYSQGYLPLWQEWAKQNPELIEELRKLSEGKTLTDQFASTRVSLARALADILNSTEPNKKNESEFESKGTTIGDDFLNEGLKEARDKIVNFIKERLNETGIRNTDDKDYPYFCLSGMAGTGKTTLINSVIGQLLADAAEGKNRFVRVIVGAISHKATQVIAGKIDPKYNATAASVASILGMTLDETTGEFKQNPMAKSIITYNSVVIIDEASMVSEEAMDLLIEECKQNNSPLIFIGDEGQLPPIRNGINSQSDEISPAFKTENKSILKERIRQGEGNPILEYADYFWRYSVLGGENNVYLSSELNNKLKEKYNAQGVMTYFNETDISKLNSIFKEAVDTRNPNLVKIVAYTNEARTNWNNTIRYSMFGENARTLQNGEILTAFNTIQDNTDPKHPKLICMNSKDYIVSDISGFRTENIFGTDIDVVDVTISSVDEHGEEVKVTTTIINPNIDSLYKYRSALDRNIKKVMSMRPRDKHSYQYQEWKRGVLKDHWNQVNKYPVLEYGYAITSHKSQGSTYDVVVVDSKDIESVGPISWKSKARSIYTALTRARNISIVMRDKKNEGGYNIKALNDRLNQLKGNNKFNDPNEVDDTEMRTCKNK